MTVETLPRVSVIVPCLDGEPYLAACLASATSGDYPRERVELIVVDNGSRDRSVEIARRFTDRVFELPGVKIGALRNRGAAEARGELLAFLDADCLARPDWLREGVRSLQSEPCVCGYPYDVPAGASWIERDWFRQRDPGRRETSGLGGGNLFVAKKDFERIGGFDESLRTGEDAEFCARARRLVKVVSDDRIKVVHLGNPRTLREFLRREIWYGIGAFGSFGVDKLDLPLLGTAVFVASSIGQLAGLFVWAATGARSLFVAATALLLALLASTAFHRRRFLHGAAHGVRLSGLYWVYYLGRSLSLFYIATGRPYYHRIEKRAPQPATRS